MVTQLSVASAAMFSFGTTTQRHGYMSGTDQKSASKRDVTMSLIANPADDARNSLLQIVTAARVDVNLAAQLTDEYMDKNGTLLPLFISSVSLIESIIKTVSEAMEIPPDKLFSGICLGLSVKAIEEQQRNQDNVESGE